jgi:hypothetical protein
MIPTLIDMNFSSLSRNSQRNKMSIREYAQYVIKADRNSDYHQFKPSQSDVRKAKYYLKYYSKL